jgi:hypothetical protein
LIFFSFNIRIEILEEEEEEEKRKRREDITFNGI